MQKVTRSDFYAKINPLDVHPSIQPGPYPYTCLWKLQRVAGQPIIGKTVGRMDGATLVHDYYLVERQS